MSSPFPANWLWTLVVVIIVIIIIVVLLRLVFAVLAIGPNAIDTTTNASYLQSIILTPMNRG